MKNSFIQINGISLPNLINRLNEFQELYKNDNIDTKNISISIHNDQLIFSVNRSFEELEHFYHFLIKNISISIKDKKGRVSAYCVKFPHRNYAQDKKLDNLRDIIKKQEFLLLHLEKVDLKLINNLRLEEILNKVLLDLGYNSHEKFNLNKLLGLTYS